MDQFRQIKLADGVRLNYITTERFRTSAISVAFALPLSSADRARASLVPFVLRRGCEGFADMTAVSGRLSELYGARLESFVRKRGEVLLTGLISDVIDERFAGGGEPLTRQAVELMCRMLLHPVTEDGVFLKEYVESEKRNMINRIQAQKNDKRSWAVRRMFQLMCEHEAYGLGEYGEEEQVQAVTPSDLYAYYQWMLAHAEMEIFYCGSLKEAALREVFGGVAQQLPAGERIRNVQTEIVRRADEVRTFMEEENVTQGKLTIGLRTGITLKDELYPAMVLFNACFGGSTASRLFLGVRERLSLCYYASSQTEKTKGVIAVSSGIENKNYERARDEILRELADLQNGGITEQELETARRSVLSSLRSMQDSPLSLEQFYQTQAVGEAEGDLDELIDRLKQTTLDEVTRAAQSASVDTIYFLKGGAGNA
ncbi:MAG: EF-P 5-aminopentanol modification-associated protein YfmF [Butyricicoccaceae bacterium]